jgi:hypothetical protein
MVQHIDVIFVSFSSPSPSSKHKQVAVQEDGPECRDEFSSGSLAGSLASGSSGFGSLSKKRGPLFSSGVFFIMVLISYLFHYSVLYHSSVTAMFVRNGSGSFSQ